jgi:pimeloyl-ACP methyl ester carboxylesterase
MAQGPSRRLSKASYGELDMHRRYENLGGTLLTIEDHGGEGPPVVLVHGLGGSAGNWALVGPRLAERGRTVALDLPGHGRSGPLPRHDLEGHIGAVRALIEHVDQGPVTLVGSSMGGLIAEMIAAEHPELVAALILVSPATPPAGLSIPPNPRIAARLAIRSAPVVGRWATAAIARRLTPEEQIAETFEIVAHEPANLPPEIAQRAIDLVRLRRTMPWSAAAFAESASSVRRTLIRRSWYRGMLQTIGAPTTLIFGALDQVVMPSALRWLAEFRRDWRSVELESVGHTPMFERPDIVVHEIQRRVDRLVGTG